MGILSHDDILTLHQAVISARLVESRLALLAAIDAHFVAGLPAATNPRDQILRDLDALNAAGALLDGSVPLRLWLKTALALAGQLEESAIFSSMLEQSYLDGAALRASHYLAVEYEHWRASSADDAHLLDARGIDIVAAVPLLPALSRRELVLVAAAGGVTGPLGYVLLSVATCWGTREYPARLRAWLGQIDARNAVTTLTALSRHPSPRVRNGAVALVVVLDAEGVLREMLERISDEADEGVRHAVLRAAAGRNLPLPVEQARRLVLDAQFDWIPRCHALRSLPAARSCLLFSDGTDFATDLGAIARAAGFQMITATASPFGIEQSDFDDRLLGGYELLILVRGEHFSKTENDGFYGSIQRFIEAGGKLLATSWVGWETAGHPFASVLPFVHVQSTYREDLVLDCRPTAHPLAPRLLARPATLRTSVELMRAKSDAVTLLKSALGLPILGYRRHGEGVCFYLNTCQHLCGGRMPSPLQTSSELHGAIVELFRWLHAPTDFVTQE